MAAWHFHSFCDLVFFYDNIYLSFSSTYIFLSVLCFAFMMRLFDSNNNGRKKKRKTEQFAKNRVAHPFNQLWTWTALCMQYHCNDAQSDNCNRKNYIMIKQIFVLFYKYNTIANNIYTFFKCWNSICLGSWYYYAYFQTICINECILCGVWCVLQNCFAKV